MRSFFILLFLIVLGQVLKAQETYPNCTDPKEINVPFTTSSDDVDQIYYKAADAYTYWYQVIASSDCELSYQMTLIDQTDDYEFLVYKNQEKSFCNAIIKNKVKPVSITKKGVLKLEKGESYFFNVVYLYGNGCGHYLTLKTAENSLNIKAIQNECVEEVMEEIVENIDAEKVEVVMEEPRTDSKETILNPIAEVEEQKQIKGIVLNSKTRERIDADINIDVNNETRILSLYADVKNGFDLNATIGDNVVTTVKKLGYKSFSKTINILSDTIIIELDPIDIGEKLIMNKVYFYPNTYVLKEESKKELNKLLDFMLENKSYSFEIQGHTNGNRMVKKNKRYTHLGEEWNFKGSSKNLSKLRAEKIKTFLIKNGVQENQLKTAGYGGDKMIIAKPKNMKEAMKNIRVEVIVLQ